MPSLDNLWKQVEELEKSVRAVIKPEYCKYLELANGQVIFGSDVKLVAFEPVIRKESNTFGPLRIDTWDQFKTSDPLRVVFFERTQGDELNIGWPTYIRSKTDPSVILRFIPAGTGSTEPFYMATHEVTNAQYRLFLEKSGAKPQASPKPPTGWSMFTGQDKKQLIISASFDYPPCGITWEEAKGVFAVSESVAAVPVTLVTYAGAQSYAQWLGTQLPTAAQHEYASRAGTKTAFPWGDDRSQISKYAHVRAASWITEANRYNMLKDNPLETAHPPLGVVKDFLDNGMLGTDKVVNQDTTYSSPWPVASAGLPNNWGLYDMIGNVWEWCRNDAGGTQSVVCGGSCLSPPDYARPDSTYTFQGRANDVGFRVMVPAK